MAAKLSREQKLRQQLELPELRAKKLFAAVRAGNVAEAKEYARLSGCVSTAARIAAERGQGACLEAMFAAGASNHYYCALAAARNGHADLAIEILGMRPLDDEDEEVRYPDMAPALLRALEGQSDVYYRILAWYNS